MIAFASILLATNVANANNEQKECKEASPSDKKALLLNDFKDNWFIGIGGGIHNYFGNHTHYIPFGKRISPIFNVYAGKWFSPIIAVRANFGWSKTTSADIYRDNPTYDSKYENVYKTKANMLSLNAETMLNVSNLIWGYNEKRIYNFIPYIGAGWVRNCVSNIDKATGTIGLLNTFKLNDKFDLNLDVKATSFGEGLDCTYYPEGKKSDITTSILVGATYYLKKRGFDREKYSPSEIEQIQDNLRALNAEKADLENKLAEAQSVKPVEIVKTKYICPDAAFFFKINKYDLADRDRVNLGFVAEAIKDNPEKTFMITGYADKATGNDRINNKLSEERAKIVYDTLVNEFNVNPSQLEIDHKGGVENMFYDKNNLSRVAIIRMK